MPDTSHTNYNRWVCWRSYFGRQATDLRHYASCCLKWDVAENLNHETVRKWLIHSSLNSERVIFPIIALRSVTLSITFYGLQDTSQHWRAYLIKLSQTVVKSNSGLSADAFKRNFSLADIGSPHLDSSNSIKYNSLKWQVSVCNLTPLSLWWEHCDVLIIGAIKNSFKGEGFIHFSACPVVWIFNMKNFLSHVFFSLWRISVQQNSCKPNVSELLMKVSGQSSRN